MRFRPEQHLRRPADFRTLREQGRRLDCGAFTLWYLSRPDSARISLPRVGVVASIAAVGAAVSRNRAKRRMRELFRQHQDLLPPQTDLLLIARAAVNRLEFPALEQKFTEACRKVRSSQHV